jgi:hypothetical protein
MLLVRGLTIPKLQTVYYSRTSKAPNADTFWQHSRIFGYDREKVYYDYLFQMIFISFLLN